MRQVVSAVCVCQASRQPALCGAEFTPLEFCRRLTRRDLGRRVFYRDAHMTGWAYKTVTERDLRLPVVCGQGKRVSWRREGRCFSTVRTPGAQMAYSTRL